MVNFVATTRRWYDKGNLRDAGAATPAEAEAAYIKSRSDFAEKTDSSALNTTTDANKAANN